MASIARAAPAAASQPATPASEASAWKPIYENKQMTYYMDASGVQKSGQSNVASLLAYKIPQVIEGAQVWSVVSHMKLSCDQKQIVTLENILYASKMGSGPVVQSQAVSDSWHQPQPGSLGGLIWSKACSLP